MSRRVAVLIGVSDYAPYELATGRPLGSVRLRGAVHDAAGYASMLRRLGVDRRDVRLLASPAPTAEMFGLDELAIGEATADHIRAAFAWLAAELAADPDAQGVVAFSGHGDLTREGDFVVYPADATTSGLSLRELAAALPRRPGSAPSVLLLETCRTGANLADAPDAPPLAAVFRPEDTVILTAASPGERALERCLDGRWQGVFAWAVQRVVEQWRATPEGFPLAYEELHARATAIVAALGARGAQTPALLATPAHRGLPFLGVASGTVSADPTAATVGSELPADTVGVMSPAGDSSTILAIFHVHTDATFMRWRTPDGSSPFTGGGFELRLYPSFAAAPSEISTKWDNSPAWKKFENHGFPLSYTTDPFANLSGTRYVQTPIATLAIHVAPGKLTWACRRGSFGSDGFLPYTNGQVFSFASANAGPTGAEYSVVGDPVLP